MWLDLVAFARALLTDRYVISEVKYFTARIRSDRFAAISPHDQSCYLDALGTNPIVKVVEGYYRRFRAKLPFAKEPCTSCGKGRPATAAAILAAHVREHRSNYPARNPIAHEKCLADLYGHWKKNELPAPVIAEEYDPDRVKITVYTDPDQDPTKTRPIGPKYPRSAPRVPQECPRSAPSRHKLGPG